MEEIWGVTLTDNNVVNFASASGNSDHIDPVGLLKDALDDIEKGAISPTRCIILFVTDKEDGTKDTYRYCSRFHKDEEIAILEMFKFFRMMDWAGGE